MLRQIASYFALAVVLTASASSQRPASDTLPGPLRDVRFEQRLGEQVPLEVRFRDESGHEVELGQYFGERPVIFAPVYYECPMLCTLVLNGLETSLQVLQFDIGKEFDVVALSFDPGETPELAAAKKAAYVKRYGRPGTEKGWHFLSGDEENIRQVTDAVGFHYVYDPQRDEYAHTAGIIVLTPAGKVARYYYGVEYSPKDLRLGLVEASEGKIGTLVDQVLLFCFHYDPVIGKYSTATMNLVRLAGSITALGLGLFVLVMLRRERKLRKATLTSTA